MNYKASDFITHFKLDHVDMDVEEKMDHETGIHDLFRRDGEALVQTKTVPSGNCYSVIYQEDIEAKFSLSFRLNFSALPRGKHVPVYLHSKSDDVGEDL